MEYADFVFLRPAFFQTGLAIQSHRKSVITIEDQVTVSLRAPDRAVLQAQLIQGDKKLDEAYTFIQRRQDGYHIQAVAPKAGQYVLRLYAKNRDAEGSYQWALDYRMTASKGGQDGFPRAYSTFSESGCYLHSPMSGRLKLGTTHSFDIQVPGADEVAVITGEKWHHLKKVEDRFTGQVVINDKQIRLFAMFPGQAQYAGLLEYTGF